MSQEELASRVFVVRQTVSKWEKGLSVPDADALEKLAETLDVPVSKLLGTPVEHPKDKDELALQLSRINEQLVIRNRRSSRIWKVVRTILITIGILIVLFFAATIVSVCLLRAAKTGGTNVTDSDLPEYFYYDKEADSTYIVTELP